MPRYYNTAEGQASGTVLSAANSGGLSGVAFTTLGGGGSCVFSNTDAVSGTQCYYINEATNQKYAAWDGLSLTHVAARMYIKFLALPAASQDLLSIQNGPKLQFITGTNIMRLVPQAGGTSFDFATAMVINTWYRYEIYSILGGSASTGTIKAGNFLGQSITPIDALYDMPGSGYAGTVNYTGVRFMKNTGSVALNAKFDNMCVDSDIAGLMGPSLGMAFMIRTAGGAWVRGYPKIRTAGGTWDDVITV